MTALADEQVAVDAECLRASGLFDVDYYTAQNPDVSLSSEDPLLHFCRIGWQRLLRPRADFDVWWYWSNHLDPGSDAVNPFVHYVQHGRAAGLRGLPDDTAARIGAALPAGAARRVCLFAGHDTDGIVDDHVVRYLTELGRFADVYYLADGYLPPSELAKLDGIAKGAWAVRHGAYDFGSYSMLAGELVGWDVIETYDELLLVNDSCYLLRPLDTVFAQMDSRPCAWWGLQATKGLASTIEGSGGTAIDRPVPIAEVRTDLLPVFEQDPVYDFHVGSYFVAYRREVITDSRFRRILDSVHRQQSKLGVILKYEVGLTHYLVGNGFAFDTFVDRLYPFHPLFTERAFAMIEEEDFPLLKKYLLYQNHYDVPGLADWQERVRSLVPDAPVEMFDRNLRRTAPDDRLHRSFSIVRDADGVVRVPEVRSGSAFRTQDRGTAKHDDWWAFPVSPQDHRLPASSRAILEEVRTDPSITKVVLTRSRPVELPGANVVVLPLLSPEGQSHLWRSRHVFVNDGPRRAIGDQLAPGQHDMVLVRDSLAMTRRGAPTSRPARVSKMPVLRFSAFLSASKVDQLSIQGTHYGLLHEQAWRTGIPAHDFLVADAEVLPDDVRLAEEQVRAALGGRRLLLFVASHRGGLPPRAPYPFGPAEVAWLRDWCARHDAVLGLREHPLDLERDYARALGEISMDLSAVRQPMLAPLLRVADAVLTDYSSAALDFMMTGRPVLSLAHDLDEAGPWLLYDLEHVFPGPVCRDFAALSDALEVVFDEPSPTQSHRYQRSRRLFLDFDDAGSAARTVRLVREVAESGVSA